MLSWILLVLSSSIGTLWSIFFILTSIIGFKIYKVDGTQLSLFTKKVKIASIWKRDEPIGWIVGKWYIGHINSTESYNGPTTNLFIFCSEKYYNKNISGIEEDKPKGNTEKAITFIEREGNFWNLAYAPRELKINIFARKKSTENNQYDCFRF